MRDLFLFVMRKSHQLCITYLFPDFFILQLIRNYIVVFLLVLWSASWVYGQEHTYTVHRGGKEIGIITASLTKSLHTQTYEILSDVTFKILWKSYHRKTSNLVVYEHETMKASYSGVYMNDDLEDSTRVNLQQNSYQGYKHPDDTFSFFDADLRFTTAKLYFQEPLGVKKVYSERFLQYCTLEALGDHKYKLNLPSGKTNYYTYVDSALAEVFIDRTWFDLKFRKK